MGLHFVPFTLSVAMEIDQLCTLNRGTFVTALKPGQTSVEGIKVRTGCDSSLWSEFTMRFVCLCVFLLLVFAIGMFAFYNETIQCITR